VTRRVSRGHWTTRRAPHTKHERGQSGVSGNQAGQQRLEQEAQSATKGIRGRGQGPQGRRQNTVNKANQRGSRDRQTVGGADDSNERGQVAGSARAVAVISRRMITQPLSKGWGVQDDVEEVSKTDAQRGGTRVERDVEVHRGTQQERGTSLRRGQ
jgi:hypothetical protein